MKKIIFITFVVFISYQNLYSQTDIKEKYKQELNELKNKSGKGNSTFKVTLKQIEKILLYKYNRIKLQSIFPEWTIVDNSIKWNYNKKTDKWDKPRFVLQYYIKVSEDTHFWVNIEIDDKIENKISTIYLISINETNYNNFINSGIRNGYKYNYSRLTKEYYKNETKKITFSPYIGSYGHSIEINKY